MGEKCVKIVVLYGSVTGTAQDISERIGRQAFYYGYPFSVLSMDDYCIADLIQESLVIFVCSTTGQGEEPDNMKQFWKFLLRKHLPNDSLSALKFAVLGLGDSSYTKFNFVAKKLFKRLLQLGATEIIHLGLADDQHDLGADAVAEDWIKELWQIVFQLFPPPAENIQITGEIPIGQPKYQIELVTDNFQSTTFNRVNTDFPILGKIVGNVRVTSEEHFQEVRLVTIDITDAKAKYEAGDVATIQPSNLQENVEEFFNIFQMNPESKLTLRQSNPNIQLPNVNHVNINVLKDWVKYYFDIQAVPRRYFFELLKNFGDNELENEKLEEFLSAAGQRDFYNYCHSARRNCLEVLQDFPNATQAFPFRYIFDLFSSIKPRSFSIASEDEKYVQLLVAVVNYKTRLAKPRLGLCSNWLSRLQVGDEVNLALKRGTFRFSTDPSVPLIMIGPGTGCAPFRGLILKRTRLNIGNNYLFFGCRSSQADFFFKDEWLSMQQQGLLHLFTAFSRDQSQKIYVQDVLLEQKKLVWQLIDGQRGDIYLAGNAKQMPKDVSSALLSIFQSQGKMQEEEANKYFKQLELEKRFQSETWS